MIFRLKEYSDIVEFDEVNRLQGAEESYVSVPSSLEPLLGNSESWEILE